ncbi:MAG: hypothetical protein K0U28_08050 [Cyanobacteria bacterium]|nr:hypothetical protein [Cyanobacteriota bacterium]
MSFFDLGLISPQVKFRESATSTRFDSSRSSLAVFRRFPSMLLQSSKPRVFDENGASKIRKNFSEFFVSDKTDGFHATIAVYETGVAWLSFASQAVQVLRFEPSALNESCRKILNSRLEGEVVLSESSAEFVCFDCNEFNGQKQARKPLLDRLKDAKQIVDALEEMRVETERFKSLDVGFSCRVKKIFDVTRENVQRLAKDASEGLVFTHAKKRLSYKWKKETTLDVVVATGTRDCFVVDGDVHKIENIPDDFVDGAVIEVVVRWNKGDNGKLSPQFSFKKARPDKDRGNAPRTLSSSIKASRMAHENSIEEILFDSLGPLVELTKKVRSDLLVGILSQQRRGRDFRVLDLAGGNGAAIVPALRYETLLIDVDADAVRVARERCRKMDGAHDMVDSSFRFYVELAMRNAHAKSKSRFFVAEVSCVQTVVRRQRVNLTLKRNCNGEQFSAPTEQLEKFATAELCKTSLNKESYDEIFILLQRHSKPTHEIVHVDTMDSFKLEGTEYCDMEFCRVKGAGLALELENGRRCLEFKTARKKKPSLRMSLCDSGDAHGQREKRKLKMEIFRWHVCDGVVVELRHQKYCDTLLNFRAVVVFERSKFDFGRLDAAPAYDASVLAVLASLAGVKHAPFPKSLSFIVGDLKHAISNDSFDRRQYERRCRLIQCHNALHFFADKNSIETFCETLKRFAARGCIVFMSFYDGETLMQEFNRVGGETLKFGLAEIQRIDTVQNGVAVGRVRFSLGGTRFAKRRTDGGCEFAVSPKKLCEKLKEHGFALTRFANVDVPPCTKFVLDDPRVIPGIYRPTPSNAPSENPPCSTSRSFVRLFDQLPSSMRTFASIELAKFYKFFMFEYIGHNIASERRRRKRRKIA